MTWNGDIAGMGRLADRLGDLAAVPSAVSARVSERLEGMIEDEFEGGHDPYGTAWKPLAEATIEKGRTPPPLTDTGAMRASLSVRPLPRAGVSVRIDHPAAAHQTGWEGPQGSGPPRPILPAGDELPEHWDEMIEHEIAAEMGRRLR